MKANLLLLLLTIQTRQVWSYTTDMPENGTEEMVTEMPNMSRLVTSRPDAPVSSGYMPQPTQENTPNIPDNHTGTDALNKTLGKTRSDIISRLLFSDIIARLWRKEKWNIFDKVSLYSQSMKE